MKNPYRFLQVPLLAPENTGTVYCTYYKREGFCYCRIISKVENFIRTWVYNYSIHRTRESPVHLQPIGYWALPGQTRSTEGNHMGFDFLSSFSYRIDAFEKCNPWAIEPNLSRHKFLKVIRWALFISSFSYKSNKWRVLKPSWPTLWTYGCGATTDINRLWEESRSRFPTLYTQATKNGLKDAFYWKQRVMLTGMMQFGNVKGPLMMIVLS